MKFLITGANGLLGSRIAKHLTSNSNEVRLLVRSKSELHKSILNEVIETDWKDLKLLSEACEGIDIVVHCAGMSSSASSNDPILAHSFNSLKTKTLLDLANKANVKKFIYLSTVHVYSNFLNGVYHE